MALDKISNEVGISWFRWRSNHYKCNTQNKSSTFGRFFFFTAQMKHAQSSKYSFLPAMYQSLSDTRTTGYKQLRIAAIAFKYIKYFG